MLAGFQSILIADQLGCPRFSGGAVVINLGDRRGNGCDGFQRRWRKREIKNEDVVPSHLRHIPLLAMMHGPERRCIAKVAPGSIGCAETIEAVGVVDDGCRGH